MRKALQLFRRRMKMLNPYKEGAYKFMRVEEADGLKTFLFDSRKKYTNGFE